MLSDRIKQFLSINVTGRVFMLCTNEGVKKASLIRVYEEEVRQALEQKALEGADLAALEVLMQEELERLRLRISGEEIAPAAVEEKTPKIEQQAKPEAEPDEVEATETTAIEKKPEKKSAKATGYKPEAAAMQEKLALERKPLGELLLKDCVQQQLLTPKRAKYWVHNLSGRLKNEVEADIVGELAQNLHDKVKKFIRKNRGCNPWPTPILQDQLRTDIISVRTVKGVLLLSSQLNREIRQCEQGDGSGFVKKIMKKFF